MKHLIAFLGHSNSRIQHPVYRQFVQTPFSRRNASLLFLSRPLEERELAHEVNALRRREGMPCEVTFHLCASFDNPLMGQEIVQTVIMIHRLYDCPTNVYCLLPNLDKCDDEQKKNAWKCLVSINNCITDYPNLQLISHCFLYHDATQVSLSHFLFNITQQPDALDEISRYGFIGKVINRRSADPTKVNIEFPSVFSSFNATGISYPEDEVRYYIHQSYLNAMLALSRPEHNKIEMERCNEHVSQIIATLPLTNDKLSLSADTFMDIAQETHCPWVELETYWKDCLDRSIKNLEDIPREEWVNQLRNSFDVCYRTRYRDAGVEFFYDKEKHKTSEYCGVLLTMLKQMLRDIMQSNPYPPETHHDIVLSIVNHLQQQAISFANQQSSLKEEINKADLQLQQLKSDIESMGFIDRMRGKDKVIFDQYKDQILKFFILRTQQAGAEFATKILNEFIPQVSSLSDRYAHLANICLELYDASNKYLQDNPPTLAYSVFPAQPVTDAAQAIRVDNTQLCSDYLRLAQLLYADNPYLDAEMLMQQLRELMSHDVDRYIEQRIAEGTISPVLGVNVVDRLAAKYADCGGISTCIKEMKSNTAITLALKSGGGKNEQYLVIAPDAQNVGPHIQAVDFSSLHVLHIISGISLADLDGFAGQRMFVEPSIF